MLGEKLHRKSILANNMIAFREQYLRLKDYVREITISS
jgi:hypothetical protein